MFRLKVQINFFLAACMLPCCFLSGTSMAFSQDEKKKFEQYNNLYYTKDIDSLGYFPGGSDSLFTFIVDHFHVKRDMGMQEGEIRLLIVTFTVDTLGAVRDVVLEEQADEWYGIPVEVEKSMIKVFTEMPPWVPSIKDGRKVETTMYVPIRYLIREGGLEIYNVGTLHVTGVYGKNSQLKLFIILLSVLVFAMFVKKW